MLKKATSLNARYRLIGLVAIFFIVSTLFIGTFQDSANPVNSATGLCLSPYHLNRGNFAPLFTWIFYEYYGIGQLLGDIAFLFAFYHFLSREDFPTLKFTIVFGLLGFSFALFCRQLVVYILLAKDFFHDSIDGLHRACSGGLSPFLTVFVPAATFSNNIASASTTPAGLLRTFFGSILAMVVTVLMTIKIRRLAWIFVFNTGSGLILYGVLWLRRTAAHGRRSQRRCCSLIDFSKPCLLEAVRLTIFAAAIGFIVLLALGNDMPRFALDGFRDIAVDPYSRPVFGPTDYWVWTQADHAAMDGVRRTKELTQAQKAHRQQVPLPPKRDYPGFKLFMNELFKRQYPPSCDNKKFLAYRMTASGAGDDLHRLAWGLAVALETDRIFILDPHQTPWRWADRDFCGSVLSPECYFLPFSNCSLPLDDPRTTTFVHKSNKKISSDATIVYSAQICGSYSCPYYPIELLMNWVAGQPGGLENESQLTRAWWHTVTTGFFWRPNQRMEHFLQQVYNMIYGTNDPESLQRSFGIHVRHGDKYKEMSLHPLADYLAAAEKIKEKYAFMAQSDVVLLSTEDPQVILDAETWNNGTRWHFIYLKDHRENDQYVISHARWHFVNAFLAAKADAFVLTSASNWCRVINELRLADGKVDHPLTDLEFKDGWE